MFRGLKNIASDIRSEVSSTEQTVYAHTHSHSQSSTGSGSARTKRFLLNSLSKHSSNGTNGGANGNGRGKSKYRLDEELDGRTEDDTVVHRALVRYFREQGKAVPAYLGGSTVSRSAGPSASTSVSTTSHAPRDGTSRFSHGSRRSHGSRNSYGSVPTSPSASTSSPEPVQTQPHAPRVAPVPQQYSANASTAAQSLNQGRPGLAKAGSDDYRFSNHRERPALQHRAQSQQQQQQQQQRTAPLNGNSVSSTTTNGGGTSPRLHSRFSSGGGGSISGSSRFGRRVQS